MESYIQISKLNDFIFCPYSLYFHSVYANLNKYFYQRTPQVVGTIKHEAVDQKDYGNNKSFLVGAEVFSEKYGLIGKIDLYDKKGKILIERKAKIKKIFDGYKYQLYGQMFCLWEMGYKVEEIFVYSLLDNKKYSIALPDENEVHKFGDLVESIKKFDPDKTGVIVNKNKCLNCIYSELCYFQK